VQVAADHLHPRFHGTQRFIAVFREALPPDSLIWNKLNELQTVTYYATRLFSHYHTSVINIWTVSGLNLSPLTGYPNRYFVTILQPSKQMLRNFFNRPIPLHYKRFLTHRSYSTHHFMLQKSCVLKSSSNIPRINPYHHRYTKFSQTASFL